MKATDPATDALDSAESEPPRKPVKPLPRATALLRSPLQQVPSNLKVAIFGVGPSGQEALSKLRRRGANVECFTDANSMNWYAKLDGVPVVAPAALRARRIDVIAVAASTAREASSASSTGAGEKRQAVSDSAMRAQGRTSLHRSATRIDISVSSDR